MITINIEPQRFTPVSNPVIFQLTSNASGLTYFIVEVLAADDSVIARQKCYTLPNLTNGTFFDLSSILKSYVNFQIVNSQNIVEPLTANILSYKLRITEYIITSGVLTTGDILNTGLFNIWNAELQLTSFSNYEYKDYALNSTKSNRFLTGQPVIKNIYTDSSNYLYLLNDGTASTVRINFYGQNNLLLGTQNLNVISNTDKAIQLNISPSVLNSTFGSSFNNLFGDEFQSPFGVQFGDYGDIYSSNYYTVQVFDSSGNAKTELRSYILKNVGCSVNHFELIYSNSLGGFDSITLFNAKESITVNKNTIDNYAYKLNNNLYSNISGGIYNDSSTVINSNAVSSYKAITDVLSDLQSVTVKDIIKADKVYVRLSNGYLLPVSITNTNYSVQLKKYTKNNNRVEINFNSTVSGLFD